jgi:hypothetical protein
VRLTLLPATFAICRLDGDAAVPGWATRGAVWSVTRRPGELSVVCADEHVPEGVRAERGFRALDVDAVMDLDVVGVLASLTAPLAAAGVALFAVSTFDTDVLLVRDVEGAVAALRGAGHEVVT